MADGSPREHAGLTADLTLGESVNNLGPVGLEVSPLPVPVILKVLLLPSPVARRVLPKMGANHVPSDDGATAAERPLTKSELYRFGKRFDTEGNLAALTGTC